MRIERIHISRLNPAAYNPRKDLKPGDPEYEALKRSIDTFDYVEPVIWNQRTGNVVGGHQRLKILIARGYHEIDVSVVDLPLEQEKALNIALNKISGSWDEEKLAELLDELTRIPEFDIAITGFELPDARALIEEVLNPPDAHDEVFDVEAEMRAQRPLVTLPGELLELGRHRLLAGDCTNDETVRHLMQGERAALFATDPPYLVDYDGTNHPGKSRAVERRKNKDWSETYGIDWDDADSNPDLYENFIRVAVAEAILPNAAWYCWHASRRQMMVESVWNQFGAFVHQQIIWTKDRPILTRSWYCWRHEPCFFGWVKGHKPPRRSRDYPHTIWEVPTVPVGQPTEHPTSKPLKLFEIPIAQHTRAGEICYEPFCGSGSQLIAAERLGRRCFAIEISPRYCDVIVRRYISYVGEANVPPELAERYRIMAASALEASGGAVA